jgi:hypothetical protein
MSLKRTNGDDVPIGRRMQAHVDVDSVGYTADIIPHTAAAVGITVNNGLPTLFYRI